MSTQIVTPLERHFRRHLVVLSRIPCRTCGGPLMYSEQPRRPWVVGWHAVFCRTCDSWIATDCEDPRCRSCATRPERPSQIDAEEVVVNRSELV